MKPMLVRCSHFPWQHLLSRFILWPRNLWILTMPSKLQHRAEITTPGNPSHRVRTGASKPQPIKQKDLHPHMRTREAICKGKGFSQFSFQGRRERKKQWSMVQTIQIKG